MSTRSNHLQIRRDQLANAMHEQARAIENVNVARELAERRGIGHLELSDGELTLTDYGTEVFDL